MSTEYGAQNVTMFTKHLAQCPAHGKHSIVISTAISIILMTPNICSVLQLRWNKPKVAYIFPWLEYPKD